MGTQLGPGAGQIQYSHLGTTASTYQGPPTPMGISTKALPATTRATCLGPRRGSRLPITGGPILAALKEEVLHAWSSSALVELNFSQYEHFWLTWADLRGAKYLPKQQDFLGSKFPTRKLISIIKTGYLPMNWFLCNISFHEHWRQKNPYYHGWLSNKVHSVCLVLTNWTTCPIPHGCPPPWALLLVEQLSLSPICDLKMLI